MLIDCSHRLLPISVRCCICKTQMAAATTAATVPARCALLCGPLKPSCVVTNAPKGPVTPPKLKPPSGLPIPTNSERFDLSHLRWLIQERPVSLKNVGDLLSFITVLDMVQDMKPNRTVLGSFAQLIEDHCLNPDYEDVCVRTMTDVIVQVERHLGEGIIGQLETLADALREESEVQGKPPGVCADVARPGHSSLANRWAADSSSLFVGLQEGLPGQPDNHHTGRHLRFRRHCCSRVCVGDHPPKKTPPATGPRGGHIGGQRGHHVTNGHQG
ncbi:uncharacterized protein LOC120517761 isoform X3 [Polypterus senegalus]|uniref:uncharacterized protein LOC120517761 isoform X3 n=1 Tax=Polypterus senegalus TaxID=55291 RepID=UPI00196571EE|nr:uncharacterized protein LOC120517761 isoform X3 [Polypterus senegalus]